MLANLAEFPEVSLGQARFQMQLMPGADERRPELRVVDVRARPLQQVTVKNEYTHATEERRTPDPLLDFPRNVRAPALPLARSVLWS